MATHKSALKKSRQDVQRRLRNRSARKTLRTALKKYRTALSAGDSATLATLPNMISLIDKSVKKGLIHRNAGSRLKAKLTVQTTKALA